MKKRCFINRRGYFFLIDSMIALGVLAIGVFMIFTLYVQVPSESQVTVLSEDIMDFFANNKIKDVDNAYAGLGGTLWQQGRITNAENTLLQQLAEFYKKSELDSTYLDMAEQFIIELTVNTLPAQYKFEFWIHDLDVDTRIYPLSPSQEHLDSKDATEILIPSKKIVYGLDQDENMFGPYGVEVLLWR